MKRIIRLVLLLVVIFTTQQIKAITIEDTDNDGVLDITLSTGEHFSNTNQNDLFNGYTSYTSIALHGDFSTTDLGAIKNNLSTRTSVDASDATFGENNENMIFSSWSGLSSFDFPQYALDEDGNQVDTYEIPYAAFQETALVNVTIPNNVTGIWGKAFENVNTLKSVTIPSTVLFIKEEAFNIENGVLSDVYIEEVPGHPANLMGCEIKAFSRTLTSNQSALPSSGTGKAAKLHYPETFFNYFVGEWKRGLQITQNSLDALNNGHGWVGTWPNYTEITCANGWQQFAFTDDDEHIIVTNDFLRTFSDNKNYLLPSSLKAYRAKRYSTKRNKVVLESLVVRLKPTEDYRKYVYNYIPANTGVVLKGSVTQSDNSYLYYFEEYDPADYNGAELVAYPYESDENKTKCNLLQGPVSEASVGPVIRDENGDVTHRLFGMYLNSSKQPIWVRFKKSTLRANRAYLQLTAEQFTNNNETAEEGPGSDYRDGTAGAKSFTFLGMATDTEEDSSNDPEVATEFVDVEHGDLSHHDRILVATLDELGVTTKIAVEEATNEIDNNFYTLQGVRVQHPAKGVYIHKGKKVVIK